MKTMRKSAPTRSRRRWKVCPAFLRPDGIRVNSHNPKGMTMAVFWPHRDLIITLYQVQLAEGSTPIEPGREILHVGHRILVGHYYKVLSPIISTWPPGSVRFIHHV
jgi:hypothetical protein